MTNGLIKRPFQTTLGDAIHGDVYILNLGLECQGDGCYLIEVDLQFLLVPRDLIDIVKTI